MGPSLKLIKHMYHIFCVSLGAFLKKKKEKEKKKENPSDFKMNSSTKAACTLTPICGLSAVTDWSMNESDPKALLVVLFNLKQDISLQHLFRPAALCTLQCKFCAWCNTDCFGVCLLHSPRSNWLCSQRIVAACTGPACVILECVALTLSGYRTR